MHTHTHSRVEPLLTMCMLRISLRLGLHTTMLCTGLVIHYMIVISQVDRIDGC